MEAHDPPQAAGEEGDEVMGKFFGALAAGIAVAAVMALLASFIVWWLWNLLCPDIFGLPEIGFWQALGITTLSRALFGFGSTTTTTK